MKAITEITKDELKVTLQFFQIGGYVTNSVMDAKVAELQAEIDALKTRMTTAENDLNSITFK